MASNKIVALFALCLVFCLLSETSAQYYGGYGYGGYGYPSSYYGGYSGYGYTSPYYGGYYGGYGYGAGSYGYYGKREAGFAPKNQQ